MSQFIYSFTGKQRPAPIVWETISFKLTGAKGSIYWSDRTDITGKDIQWVPLDSVEGILTGAGLLQVRIEEMTAEFAMLEVVPTVDSFDRALGELAAQGSRANHAEAAFTAAVFQR